MGELSQRENIEISKFMLKCWESNVEIFGLFIEMH